MAEWITFHSVSRFSTSTGDDDHKSVNLRCVLTVLFKYEYRVRHFFVLSCAMVQQFAQGSVVSEFFYVEWYGVCNILILFFSC